VPEQLKLPSNVEGPYLILLRVEASDDKEADSDLASLGVGAGIVHNGAVAGFPLPPLRYYVGNAAKGVMTLISPADNYLQPEKLPVDFQWGNDTRAALYKLEVASKAGETILSALLASGVTIYRAPSWLPERLSDGRLRWRIIALDAAGNSLSETSWRNMQLTK
jgi:hypothetical protein